VNERAFIRVSEWKGFYVRAMQKVFLYIRTRKAQKQEKERVEEQQSKGERVSEWKGLYVWEMQKGYIYIKMDEKSIELEVK